MLRQSEPTSSTLQLVANDMTGIMEKLDDRELDMEDGEYDTTDDHLSGECVFSAWRSPTIISLSGFISAGVFLQPSVFLSR